MTELKFEKIDLGSFGITEENPLRSTLSEAVKISPDEYAKTRKASNESGVPTFAVENDKKAVEDQLKFEQIDFSTLSKETPNTANYFTNFENAAAAHDDIDNLSGIEKTLAGAQRYGADVKAGIERGSLTVEASRIGLNQMYSVYDGSFVADRDQNEQMKRLDEINAGLSREHREYGFFTGAPIAAAEMLPILGEIADEAAYYGAAGGVLGAGSLGTVGAGAGGVGAAPGAVSGFISGTALGAKYGAAKGAFDVEAGIAFNEFISIKDPVTQQTIDPKIAAYAATTVGLINSALEMFSLQTVGKTVTPVVRHMIKRNIKKVIAKESGKAAVRRIATNYAGAVVTEGVTEGMQELTNIAGGEIVKMIDKDVFKDQDINKVVDNIISIETLDRVAEAAKVGTQAGMVFSAPGTAASVYVESTKKQKLSEVETAKLDALNNDSELSKLRNRDKESFKQFVEEVDADNNTTVFIDGAQVSLYLQEKTPGEISADPALQLLSEQVAEAAAIGGEVQISVADFAGEIAGTEHYKALRDSMTMSEHTVPPFRQEQEQVETQNYIQRMMAEAQESVSEYVEAQEIYQDVRQQLIDSGRVTPQNASVMAKLVPAWTTAKAQRENKTVQQVYEEAGLVIEGPLTGERARLEGELDVLTQVKATINDIEAKHDENFDTLLISENEKDVTVSSIIVPKEGRKKGAGTALMQDVTDYADQTGKVVRLTPGVKDDRHGTTSRKRLVKFYKRFGFVENKGKNKDFTYNAGEMYREPSFKQPTSEDVNGVRGYYDPNNSLIRMTETSNMSTFLHEYGHFMYDMEGRGNTDMFKSINNWFKRDSAAVAKEANTFLNKEKYDAEKQDGSGTRGKVSDSDVTTYIDAGTTGSKSKDAAINRSIHERFSRGFETYLMEGKAPSIELRNAFATIARWLTNVYKAIRGDLNVRLDPEMNQLYDRLLATEEQIAAAEARARFEPMFTDAAMAGMTEKEFEAYKKKQEKTKDKETETLREKLIKQLTRQTKKWWREEKADIAIEETEKIKTEKVYIAARRLKAGGEFKLDFATVKDMVGELKTDKLGRKSKRISPKLRGMTAKEHQGIHPDQAAAMFGYTSGAAMLHDIINAPSIKEVASARAEEIMIERHGDIMTDGTIERAADDAVKNEERGKMIFQELKVLSRGTTVPTIDRMTIKAIAKEKIGQLSFREIFPGKYRKAEIKASQEAALELKAGNKHAAASAKMRQVMNYYLGIEASEAKAGAIKIVDRMSRYNKKKVREEIIRAENGYWDQLDKILNRFEFRKSVSLKAVENINTWMKDQVENEGAGLTLSNAVLDEGYITHWKNVPYNDLQGIDDSVKNIEHVAKYSNKIDLLQEKVDFKKVVNDWVDSMNEKVESEFTPTASEADAPAKWRKWGRWAMAQMTKIPFMASWLDGGERVGMSHQILVQRFTDAYDAEVRLWDKAAKPVMELINNRSKEDVKRHNTKYYIPEIAGTAFHTGNMMGHEIIAVALNTGNESNLRKLLLGEQWATSEDETTISFQNPKLQAVLSKMTVSDWKLVQTIWDQMETLYPTLAEVHRKTTGLVPPKIEKTPIEVQGLKLDGGYYPMKYDPARDNKAQENEDKLNAQTESMFSNTASIQASVNIGATNERTKYYAPVRLSLDVVQNHFQETIHYITHHDAVRQVNKLIRDNSVTNTIKAKLGPDEYAQLKPWLNDIAKDGREAPVKMYWDDILQKLRFGITLGVMGFKASTGIIQISGLSNTFAEVGTASTLQALRSVVGSPRDMRGAWNFAKENSKVMNHRVNTMDREIKNAMSKLQDKKGFKAAVQEASMKHIALIQTYMVDLPTWHAGYIEEMKRSGDEQKAYQYGDWLIENIQGSGITKDMAAIMRGQSETARMMTMFMTYFSSLWNLERDFARGIKRSNYSVTTIAAKTAFLFVIPVLFEMIMRGELGGDKEPEEKLQKMLTGVALYPAQSVPFIRDIASATIGEYGYNISPVASLIKQGTQAAPGLLEAALTDEEITKSQAKSTSKAAGALIGLPGTGQAWATGEHLYQVLEEGEEFTFHQLLFGPRRK